jgi:Flp pilus assembly secretin CpaC
MIRCHNGGILMKILGQVLSAFSLLFFGQLAIVAAQPTNDAAPSQLYSRTFKVYPETFLSGANQVEGSTNPAVIVSADARRFITNLGVDLTSPPGKAVFYNDRLGKLFVKATTEDLDVIEMAISKIILARPLIHLKARFIEIPKDFSAIWKNEIAASNLIIQASVSTWQSTGDNTNSVTTTNAGSWWASVLINKDATTQLKYLESGTNAEWLAEPETTVSSGLATQIRATEIQSLIKEKQFQISGPATMEPYSPYLETGPILDVIARVSSDGQTINAVVKPTVTALASNQQLVDLIKTNSTGTKILPVMQHWQAAANVSLWDGQTIVIGGLPVPELHTGHRLPPSQRELLIFITLNIVDKAGNRLHSDLPFSQQGIPSQPK